MTHIPIPAIPMPIKAAISNAIQAFIEIVNTRIKGTIYIDNITIV
jgi:hypothetical protein